MLAREGQSSPFLPSGLGSQKYGGEEQMGPLGGLTFRSSLEVQWEFFIHLDSRHAEVK